MKVSPFKYHLYIGNINRNKGAEHMTINIIITVALVLAIFSSIAAWLNTQIILRELSEIKAKLGIAETKKSSFLDKDLDND